MLIQPAGIVFKGSGWYVAESRKKDKGAFISE
jgi:predicted nucleic acid-binding Zn ribbon protein